MDLKNLEKIGLELYRKYKNIYRKFRKDLDTYFSKEDVFHEVCMYYLEAKKKGESDCINYAIKMTNRKLFTLLKSVAKSFYISELFDEEQNYEELFDLEKLK